MTRKKTPFPAIRSSADVSVPAVNQHLKRIFTDNELEEKSVIKEYLITGADGKSLCGYILGIFVILVILNMLTRYSMIGEFRMDAKGVKNYNLKYYSLSAIIAVWQTVATLVYTSTDAEGSNIKR